MTFVLALHRQPPRRFTPEEQPEPTPTPRKRARRPPPGAPSEAAASKRGRDPLMKQYLSMLLFDRKNLCYSDFLRLQQLEAQLRALEFDVVGDERHRLELMRQYNAPPLVCQRRPPPRRLPPPHPTLECAPGDGLRRLRARARTTKHVAPSRLFSSPMWEGKTARVLLLTTARSAHSRRAARPSTSATPPTLLVLLVRRYYSSRAARRRSSTPWCMQTGRTPRVRLVRRGWAARWARVSVSLSIGSTRLSSPSGCPRLTPRRRRRAPSPTRRRRLTCWASTRRMPPGPSSRWATGLAPRATTTSGARWTTLPRRRVHFEGTRGVRIKQDAAWLDHLGLELLPSA